MEYKIIKSRNLFHFKLPSSIERSWVIGLTNLKVYNSFYEITEEINNFELYTDNFDDFSFTELKDELEEILDILNITHEHLQDKIIGPRINKTYKKLGQKRE